jgi:hypothetical protein
VCVLKKYKYIFNIDSIFIYNYVIMNIMFFIISKKINYVNKSSFILTKIKILFFKFKK